MKNLGKTKILFGLTFALGCSDGVLAQAVPEATAAETDGSDAEIVVTATRRAENLANVPIPITAISGDALQRSVVLNTQDLSVVVPGLVFGRNTNFNQPTIRGIGPRGVVAGDEPNVATYFDGVYMPDAASTLLDLTNVERIEVLKGPQGTLFGRNATGGAISIITKKPTSNWEGSASATYGRFDYYRLAGYISGPIVDDLISASISGVKFGDDGYIRNVFLDKRTGESDGQALRGKLLVKATPDLELQLNGLYVKSSSNTMLNLYSVNGNSQARSFAPGLPLAPVFNPTNIPLSELFTAKPYTTVSAMDPTATMRSKMVDGHLVWDLGFATLSGLASFAGTKTTTSFQLDNSPLLLATNEYRLISRSRNQELVLSSNNDSNLKWLIGLTAFQGKSQYDPLIGVQRLPPTGAPLTVINIVSGQRTRAYAGFGELTYMPVDNLYLTGGVRYSSERKTSFFQSRAPGSVKIGDSNVFNNVSPRAVVRYQFAPNSNVYASFTRGFKSGFYNVVTAFGSRTRILPETITAYEAGIKARIIPGLHIDGSVFHYKTSNLQVLTTINVDGASLPVTQNAASAKVDGAELSATWEVTPQLTLNGALSLLDPQFSDFPNAVISLPITVNGVPTLTGSAQTIADLTGNDLIRAPRRTLSIGANWKHDLFGGTIIANVNAFFSAKYYQNITNHVTQPAYEVVNASLTWQAPGAMGAYITVFAQNLTNQVYALGGFVGSASGDFVQANKPRWLGVTLGFRM